MCQYTGLHPKFLEELWSSDDVLDDPEEPVQLSVILDHLLSFYLAYKMPTTRELFMHLHGKIPKYIDVPEFREILKHMGMAWIRNKETTVVFDKPIFTFRRFNYLKNIINYRKEEKNIVNICELAYDFLGNCYDATQSSCLSKVFPLIKQTCWMYAITRSGAYNWTKVDKFDRNTFQNYVIELSKKFNTPTVFIYDRSVHHNEKVCAPPKLKTLKVDLIKWLELHNIPYDQEASKYHLLQLIQKKQNEETETDFVESLFKVDRRLIAEGHLVLRLPNSIKNISPGYYLTEKMRNNIKVHNHCIDPNEFALQEYDQKRLQVYDEKFVTMIQSDTVSIIETADICGQETKIFDTDIKVDRIMDQVKAKRHEVSKVRDVQDLVSDLPCNVSE
ncbi:hypothetical protein K1T71_013345 [Dendrolimus kikuchii]|uniref:Uncharacterized protein n=1 Tax=Dendrolimus kikuchii TaxID=765133 RepID=A0ACC1CHU7_9NEOP|nr:hypothetical protein K1T71_013345 [Dendrolimus kikuchii]